MEKLSISLTPEDQALIQQLVRRFGLIRCHAVCRAALRAGLTQFDCDHARSHAITLPTRFRVRRKESSDEV